MPLPEHAHSGSETEAAEIDTLTADWRARRTVWRASAERRSGSNAHSIAEGLVSKEARKRRSTSSVPPASAQELCHPS